MFLVKLLCVYASLLTAALAFPSPPVYERSGFEETPVMARRNGTNLRRALPKQGGSSTLSTNWAGGVLSANAVGTWQIVTGTFTLPTIQRPAGSTGPFGVSIWVGIDGDTCTSATFQTGIDIHSDGTTTTYTGWFEWFPDFSPINFPGITFSAGDSVTLTVLSYLSSSRTKGTAVVSNNSNGQLAVENIGASTPLCQQDAAWVVSTFSTASASSVPYADFGSVTFGDALAFVGTGGVGGVGFLPAAQLVDMVTPGGQIVSSVSTTQSTVTVNYV